jgi:copper chaperone
MYLGRSSLTLKFILKSPGECVRKNIKFKDVTWMSVVSHKRVHLPMRNSLKVKKREECMATIKITGMSCQHCVMAVTKSLTGIDGVSNVKVSLEKGEASFDETKPVDMSVIRERIKKAGFDVA